MVKPNVSAALILDKRSTKKDGTSPVKVRIIFNRTNKKLYSIGHDATDDDWFYHFDLVLFTCPTICPTKVVIKSK